VPANAGCAPVRIAVTSRDGVGVNERFHRATDYFVFELRDGRAAFVERRRRPAGDGRLFRDFSTLERLLAGCRWVVSLGFNGEARRELSARGFLLHEARGPIETVLRALPSDSLAPPAGA